MTYEREKEPAEESKMQTHSLSQPKREREIKLEEGKCN